MQSDVGDYDPSEHGLGIEYVKHTHFAPNQGEELLEKIVELHKTHRSEAHFVFSGVFCGARAGEGRGECLREALY